MYEVNIFTHELKYFSKNILTHVRLVTVLSLTTWIVLYVCVRAHPGHSLGLGCASRIISTRRTGSLQRLCRTSVATGIVQRIYCVCIIQILVCCETARNGEIKRRCKYGRKVNEDVEGGCYILAQTTG
jgi:hypothetical protein